MSPQGDELPDQTNIVDNRSGNRYIVIGVEQSGFGDVDLTFDFSVQRNRILTGEADSFHEEERDSMIYFEDDKLTIRNMETEDAQVFTDELIAQGWHPDIAGYMSRLKDQTEGKCIALSAVYEGYPAGYVYVYLHVEEGPFKGKGWPIIVDFNVLKKYQRRGIGNRLMDAAEEIAGRYADTVCLGVGVCDSYGAAQRIYIKRGYIPDGSGVWYKGRQCVQYETVCTVDDDLILFLYKKLRG